MAHWIVETLVRTSAETLLAASMDEDNFSPGGLSRELLAANEGVDKTSLVAFQIGLTVPLVGLGASAATYYPDVAEKLKTDAVIPEHAGVANALGAVVGYVRVSAEATITMPEAGLYRVFLAGRPENFGRFEDALTFAEAKLGEDAKTRAIEAGAGDVEIKFSHDENIAVVEGQEMLVECLVRATASGRPRIAI